jgi:hypothetical protein
VEEEKNENKRVSKQKKALPGSKGWDTVGTVLKGAP